MSAKTSSFKEQYIRWPSYLGHFSFIYYTGLILFVLFVIITPSMLAQGEGQAYTIQRDDTLWKVAEKLLGDGNYYQAIIAATNAKHAEDSTFTLIEDPNVIEVGSKLWVPAADALPSLESISSPSVASDNAASAAGIPTGQIAFSFWNNSPERCTYEIDVINVQDCLTGAEACQATRRIFALNNVSEPALSPDGQQLAFRGWGDIPEEYNDEELDHPYFNCAGPMAQRRLGQTTLDATDYIGLSKYWEDSHPDWSPDGTRLLFDTDRNPDEIVRILLTDADGTYEEELQIAGQQPSWAPDGERFVFRGCDPTGNRCGLWTALVQPLRPWEAGLNLIGPVLEEAPAAHPDWSPVSDEVVYQSSVNGSFDLYVIKADGSGKRQLTDGAGIEGLPAWSPDGQWIAHLSDEGGNWGIWIIRADGSERQLLFPFDGGIFTPAAITPYFTRDWLDEQISWSN